MKPHAILALGAALLLAGCPQPGGKTAGGPTPPAKPTPTPVPATPPPPYVPGKRLELGKIFNGMQYKVSVETEFGTTTTRDRNDEGSYTAELIVKAKIPKAHKEMSEITQLNAKLPELFPQLQQLIERAAVSPFFDDLYRLKVSDLNRKVNRLDVVLSRHNFYDCETILELQHPETKRKALFIQADMDVDEDGSDSDRIPFVDGSSLTYQPMTSYRWAKRTDKPNPFIAPREQALAKAKEQLAQGGLSTSKIASLKDTQKTMEMEIADLKRHSFLVGAVDPFIVVPRTVSGKDSPYSVGTGDYCVVVHEGVLYPAFVGDIGPAFKMGEASLRICKELNAHSSSIMRPVSDLKVTYIVFPGTNERPWGPPDLPKLKEKCAKLVEELGGTTGEMFTWTDMTAPPAPAPEPAPAAGATPAPAPATPAPTTPKPAKK